MIAAVARQGFDLCARARTPDAARVTDQSNARSNRCCPASLRAAPR